MEGDGKISIVVSPNWEGSEEGGAEVRCCTGGMGS